MDKGKANKLPSAPQCLDWSPGRCTGQRSSWPTVAQSPQEIPDFQTYDSPAHKSDTTWGPSKACSNVKVNFLQLLQFNNVLLQTQFLLFLTVFRRTDLFDDSPNSWRVGSVRDGAQNDGFDLSPQHAGERRSTKGSEYYLALVS